jgi:hypothetical protein
MNRSDCDMTRASDGLLFPYRIGEELPTKRPLCETWARMSHPDPNGAPDPQTHESRRGLGIQLPGNAR